MALKDKEKRAAYSKRADPIYREKKRQWLRSIKEDLQCEICGEARTVCLDFHHRNPDEKEGTINEVLYKWSKERILAEIAKCSILCANCHRVEHEKE